jgi:4-phospho-D-threonate 3-dehydrogenase / 4-phospho-D-erythronate 3-dehydrogenase
LQQKYSARADFCQAISQIRARRKSRRRSILLLQSTATESEHAMTAKNLPLIGITMGDPSGIGPEIAVKALEHPDLFERCRPVIIGDAGIIRRATGFVGSTAAVNAISDPANALSRVGLIDVYDLPNIPLHEAVIGKISAASGRAAFEAIKAAVELATAGKLQAIVTGPIHKEALCLAGHRFAGHTEILAALTDAPKVAMMLAEGNLRVVHVSTHVSLRQACDLVKRERVLAVIRLAHEACRQLGIDKPRVGVAGLNPHAGETGLFGDEERQEIEPAVRAAVAEGIDATGPFPPDTFFPRAMGGAFDVCVAMYHDQGHVPVKLAGFQYDAAAAGWSSVRGVNITLGLPIVRTSVDHGTAFDQAGAGRASEDSLIDAIDYAIRLAKTRQATK